MAQWRDKCSREVIYPKAMRTAEFVYPALDQEVSPRYATGTARR